MAQFGELLKDDLDSSVTYLQRWNSEGTRIRKVEAVAAPNNACLDLETGEFVGTPIPFVHQTGAATNDPVWLQIRGQDFLCRFWRDFRIRGIDAPLVLAFRSFLPRANIPSDLLDVVNWPMLHNLRLHGVPVHLYRVYRNLQWLAAARLGHENPIKVLIQDQHGELMAFHSELALDQTLRAFHELENARSD